MNRREIQLWELKRCGEKPSYVSIVESHEIGTTRVTLKPQVLAPPHPVTEDGRVTTEAVIWAFRFLIGREPSTADIAFHRQHSSLEDLRRAFFGTQEFSTYHRSLQPPEPYRAPLWLLRPPVDHRIGFALSPPSIARPVSQLCTQGQMEEPAFLSFMEQIGSPGLSPHRKRWEFGYILAVLKHAGVLRPGARGLGFGVGQEALPSLFASHGVDVVATDAPSALDALQGWANSYQHSSDVLSLFRPQIVGLDAFRRHVSFQAVDMNKIPGDLRGFDFCWSACCFEHLGSLRHGLDFFANSVECLRPGGVAVHTTEFNLTSNDETLENPVTSIFRRKDIEELMSRLLDAGHQVWPLNLHPGEAELDEHVDLPPYALPHLKLEISRYTCTSIGIVAIRGSL